MTTPYGFTYKSLSKTPIQKDYDIVLDKLRSKGDLQEFVYERDSKNKLHIHGIVKLPSRVWFKSLMVRGFHQRFEELYDTDGWLRYIHKDTLQVFDSYNKNTDYMFESLLSSGEAGIVDI